MNATAETEAGSGWIIDLIPAACAAQLCGKLPALLHMEALTSGLLVFLTEIFGFGIVVGASFLVRTLIRRTIKRRVIANWVGAFAAIVLAAGFIAASAAVETPGQAQDKHATQTPGEENRPLSASPSRVANDRDRPIVAQTSLQDAGSTADKDITREQVGDWATSMMQQAKENAETACLKKGGDPTFCTKFSATETHEVMVERGRKVAIIRTTLNYEGTTEGHSVRLISLKGHQLVSVGCVRGGDQAIDIRMGPCADEIAKSLGIRLDPG